MELVRHDLTKVFFVHSVAGRRWSPPRSIATYCAIWGCPGYESPISIDAHHILQQPYVPAQCDGDHPGLKDSYYDPSAAIKKVGETPLALFLFFMPPALWRDIAVESNLYHLSTINKRADAKYTKHKHKNSSSDKTRAQFKAVLQQI
ncbi:hypothetical protein DVH05_009673 [Phytophthora capsici]|nr:hypothetical protein DVH05_009673 [Phytophthora capsici]